VFDKVRLDYQNAPVSPKLKALLTIAAKVQQGGKNVLPDDIAEDVGKAAVFLCSDMASGVTAEILYVDGGFSTVGMSFVEPQAE